MVVFQLISLPLWMTSVGLIIFALSGHEANAQPVKVDVSFSTFGVSEAHNVPAAVKTGANEAQISLSGDERIPCSNLPASKSTSSAYATGSLVKKDDSSVSLSLNANVIARGGRFEQCNRCDGQFCSQSSGPQRTEAKARSEARANISYQFPRALLSSSLKSFRIQVSILDGNADVSKLSFKLRRKSPAAEMSISPDRPVNFTPRANEEIIVELALSALVRTSDETDTKQDEPRVKLRIDISEAPVLDAAIQEGYILKGVLTADFKAVGLIAMVDDGGVPSPHCTGTVVGTSMILTAAHCVSSGKIKGLVDEKRLLFLVGSKPEDMKPVVISSYFFPQGELPDKFKFNVKFDRTLEDDIAILLTEQPIGILPMPLYEGVPSVDSIVQSKINITFVGFGLDPEAQTDTGPGKKRMAVIPIVRSDNSTFFYTSEANGSNTCHGDSGGPALIQTGSKLEVIGVTSYGSADCRQGRSMRVDRYLSWIRAKLAQ